MTQRTFCSCKLQDCQSDGDAKGTTSHAELQEINPDSELPGNVIDPRRRFKKTWDAIVVCAAMYTAAVLPCVSINHYETSRVVSRSSGFLVHARVFTRWLCFWQSLRARGARASRVSAHSLVDAAADADRRAGLTSPSSSTISRKYAERVSLRPPTAPQRGRPAPPRAGRFCATRRGWRISTSQ